MTIAESKANIIAQLNQQSVSALIENLAAVIVDNATLREKLAKYEAAAASKADGCRETDVTKE